MIPAFIVTGGMGSCQCDKRWFQMRSSMNKIFKSFSHSCDHIFIVHSTCEVHTFTSSPTVLLSLSPSPYHRPHRKLFICSHWAVVFLLVVIGIFKSKQLQHKLSVFSVPSLDYAQCLLWTCLIWTFDIENDMEHNGNKNMKLNKPWALVDERHTNVITYYRHI